MVESTEREAPMTPTAGDEKQSEMSPNPQTVELIEDKIVLNEDFKKNVAIPYFKDIYKDLAAQSDSKSKGINKVSILNVSITYELSRPTRLQALVARLTIQATLQLCVKLAAIGNFAK